MDRGAWRATVHGGHKELDTTDGLTHTHTHTHTYNIHLCEVSSVGLTICILQIRSLKVKELHMISSRWLVIEQWATQLL